MEENNTLTTGQYLIRIRKGDWEIEVAAPDAEFVLHESSRLMESLLAPVLTLPDSNTVQATVNGQELARNEKQETLGEFFNQFKFQTNLEKILVLGYWCEVRMQQPGFTQEDIRQKFKEVKEPIPANLGRDLSSLVGKSWLSTHGKTPDGAVLYELTRTGIKEVETKLARA